MFGAKWLKDRFSLPTLADALAEQQRATAHSNETLACATAQPAALTITVGRVVQTDYFAPHTGISVLDTICRFNEYLLDRMILVIGEIGSGKTTGCLTLMQQTACYTARDIFFINYKGDHDTNEKARRILYPYRGHVPIVSIDPLNVKRRYNPFKYGDGLAIANRWIRLLGLEHYEGSGEYYADLHRGAILLICLGGDGPPRTLPEMKRRLNPTGAWIDTAYPTGTDRTPAHPNRWQVDLLLYKEKGQLSPWQKLGVKTIPLFNQLEYFISEDGWTPDEGSGIISVPSAMYPDTAKKVGDVIVIDLMHFMHPASGRQKREVMIFWDEFQSAGNKEITGILSQGRQFKCGVMLATQDINKLGSDLEQKVLASDTTTLIAFRTQQSADFVARTSGTVKQPAVTMQIVEGETGNQGTVREENEYRIHPNAVAQLPDGYCYITRHRTTCKVRFHLPIIPDNVPAELTYQPPIVEKQPEIQHMEEPPEKPKVKKRQ